MNHLILLPAIFIWACLTSANAQSPFTITGNLNDESEEVISYANIVLYDGADTSIVKMNYSEDNGDFLLETDQAGSYFIEITYIGLQGYRSQPFELNPGQPTKEFSTITLKVQGETLKELVVTARKPLLEVKPDKMVVNVAGSINAAGNNALELLRKSPGVMVDHNENISLMGKSGIQIYINGKRSPLNGDQLANYLKSLPSEDIENIELITQPSAKYDAEGNAGIINIVLRKNQSEGYNTNIATGYSQGEKARYNGSVNTNLKKGKFNVYGALSYNNNQWPNSQVIYREQNGMVFDQQLNTLSSGEGLNYRGGIDYSLSSKSILGIMIHGNTNEWDWAKESTAYIRSTDHSEIDSILISDGGNFSKNTNTNYNINYKYTGEKDQSLNIDADYGVFGHKNHQDQPNIYTDASGQEILQRRDYYIEAPSEIEILTIKTDYEQPVWAGKMGTGLKWSKVLTDNTFDFYNVFSGDKFQDMDRSNDYTYDEQVFAGYLTYNTKINKWGIKGGLRAEHTRSRGILESQMQTELNDVRRNYTDIFPSLGFTYDLSEKNVLQLSYSRRINRPNYNSLNPFEFKLDELTYEKGNPFLSPEYTNKLQLSHTWNHMITSTLGYSETKDMISQLIEVADGNAAYQTYQNLASQKDISFNVSGSIPIVEWWSAFSNATYNYRETFGEVNQGQEARLHLNSFNFYSQHTFTLPSDFSLELDGFYNSPTIWGGQFVSKQQWGINLGVQKKLFDNKANLKVAINDIFNTMRWESNSKVGDFFLLSRGNWDSQQLKVSFSYSLGNNKIKSRQRSTGLEDEKNRVGG